MKCPGQDTQYWTAGAIFEVSCPQCNQRVEFFKDDTTRKCGNCGHRFVNPKMDFGCAAYCQYAEQCLGDLPPELVAQQENLLKDRVAVAVKRYLKTDFKRIGHISRRVRHAEQMGKHKQVILPVLLIAASLWGLDEAGSGNELPVARGILTNLNAPPPLVDEVCKVIAQRGKNDAEAATAEYELLMEADRQAALEAAGKTS
jgi:DNA-directed RNA polymerase subunit RPC12/RpoP